jgi:hypothetical protein
MITGLFQQRNETLEWLIKEHDKAMVTQDKKKLSELSGRFQVEIRRLDSLIGRITDEIGDGWKG